MVYDITNRKRELAYQASCAIDKAIEKRNEIEEAIQAQKERNEATEAAVKDAEKKIASANEDMTRLEDFINSLGTDLTIEDIESIALSIKELEKRYGV